MRITRLNNESMTEKKSHLFKKYQVSFFSTRIRVSALQTKISTLSPLQRIRRTRQLSCVPAYQHVRRRRRGRISGRTPEHLNAGQANACREAAVDADKPSDTSLIEMNLKRTLFQAQSPSGTTTAQSANGQRSRS